MTPHETAQQGLSLLKEAILDFLKTRPEGVRSVDVRKALALKSDVEGTLFKGHWVVWSLLTLLVRGGKVEQQTPDRQRRYRLPSEPEAKA